MAKNYKTSILDFKDRKGNENVRVGAIHNTYINHPISGQFDKAIKEKYFIFELLDSRPSAKECIVKLSYESVFNALSVLMEYCVETPIFAELDEMLEYVAVSPHSLLLNETKDIADFYYSVEEYVESLCGGFFNSEEDMLNINIDNKRFSDRKSMVRQYRDIAHVFVQWLSIFGSAIRNNQTILIYADFMTNETLVGS